MAAERRAELRDANASNVVGADPTLAAPWDKYGKPFWYDAEGWRRFLEWAEEHPREVLDARERAARKNFAREAREHAHAERERRREEVPF